MVRVPGLRARRVKEPVGHVDIAPTLVNLARGPQEKSFLGRSMVDLLARQAQGHAPRPIRLPGGQLRARTAALPEHVERRGAGQRHPPPDLELGAREHLVLLRHRWPIRRENRDLWGTPAGEEPCGS